MQYAYGMAWPMLLKCVTEQSFKKVVLLFGCLLLLCIAACEKKPDSKRFTHPFQSVSVQPPHGSNLLLIVVDTLRADRVGAYGYERKTTPTMDAFAKESVLFENNYANSPWTAPSFGSMLTGVRPSIHRTGRWIKRRRLKGTVMVGAVQLYPLDKRLKTLAQVLGKTMKTATFASNPFLDPKLGFARGVDHYDQTYEHRRGRVVTDLAGDWMNQNSDEPFFVMLHYMDPHTPYDPPRWLKKKFVNENKRGRIQAPFVPGTREALRLNPNADELAYVKGLYDGEVRYVDEQLKRLFKQMDSAGLMDSTWIVLTADHGEEHWDHGGFNHGYQYEDEVTRVPLIIRAPGGKWGAGMRVPYSVSLMDLYATSLDMFGIEPAGYLESKSLFDLVRGREKGHRPIYMEYQLFFQQKYAYFNGRYKLVRPRRGNYSSGFMYDLYQDPLEQNKLDSSHSAYHEVMNQLHAYRQTEVVVKKRLMNDFVQRGAADSEPADSEGGDDAALSEEAVKALRALGYLE